MKKKQVLVISIFLVSILFMSSYISVKSDSFQGFKYTVDRIVGKDNFVTEFRTNDFNEANNKMKQLALTTKNVVVRGSDSLSPLKIVAADRAYIHTIGSRSGLSTIYIYPYSNLSGSAKTYIPNNYKMFYYETIYNDGDYTALASISGTKGYVSLKNMDIIPFIYVENEWSIALGGNGATSYSKIIDPEYFYVQRNGAYGVDELYFTYEQTIYSYGPSHVNYDIAPSWLTTGTRYYSDDGIVFYTDIDRKNVVNGGKEFYAYFQWLPLRTESNLSVAELENAIIANGYQNNSVIMGKTDVFVTMGKKYGMNPLLIYSQALLESAYGSSNLAKTRYNLFGFGAADSRPGDATYFTSVNESIMFQMASTGSLRGYLNHQLSSEWRFEGYSFGDKGTGISVRYASDPYYGIKIAGLSYRIDRNAGFKDINKYSLAKINDGVSVNMRKGASTSDPSWYTTKSGKRNQMITVLDNKNEWIKTNLSGPVQNGVVVSTSGLLDIAYDFNAFGYLHTSNITLIDREGGTTPTNPTPGAGEKIYEVTYTDVRVRSGPSTSTTILGYVQTGYKFTGTNQNNGWIKFIYNGQEAYIYTEYTKEIVIEPEVPVEPEKPIEEKEYVLTFDTVNIRNAPVDGARIGQENTGFRFTGKLLESGWIEFTYSGQKAYVSSEFAKEYTEPEVPNPVVKRGDINGDGKIDIRDLASIKSHMMNVVKLNSTQSIPADVNNDGVIDIRDLAAIKSHMMGIVLIKWV